jgi:hypothetical protein
VHDGVEVEALGELAVGVEVPVGEAGAGDHREAQALDGPDGAVRVRPTGERAPPAEKR